MQTFGVKLYWIKYFLIIGIIKPTSLLGRWQPFHEGHYKLFLQALKKADRNFYVKDVYKLGDNPFTFKKVKRLINIKLEKMFKNRYKVQLAPNVTNVLYGRKVGYQIIKINLEKRIQNISVQKLKLMRKKGILKNMIVALMIGRKGSRGFKGKNTFKILNKAMREYPLIAANKSKFIDKVYVATDCPKIKK